MCLSDFFLIAYNLGTAFQVIKFISYVFLPEIEQAESAYEEKLANMKDVLSTFNSYTDIMINKSVQSFASWCRKRKCYCLMHLYREKDKSC